VCIPDLVIIKYFVNNTAEIKRIVFTYPDLLPPTTKYIVTSVDYFTLFQVYFLKYSFAGWTLSYSNF